MAAPFGKQSDSDYFLDKEEQENIDIILARDSKDGEFLVPPIEENIGALVFIEESEFSTDEVFIVESFDFAKGFASCKRIDDGKIYCFRIGQLRSIDDYQAAEEERIEALLKTKRYFFQTQILNVDLN